MQLIQSLFSASSMLGTDASFITDLNLLTQILFFLLLCIGVIAHRKGYYHWHDRIQTPVVILNLALIGLVMVPSARAVVGEMPARFQETFFLLPAIHIALGTLSEGLAIYCLLAGHNILPRRFGVLRYWMWMTFILWTAAVLFGIGTYLFWYGPPAAVADTMIGQRLNQMRGLQAEQSAPVETATPTATATEPPATPEQPPTETPTPQTEPTPAAGSALLPTDVQTGTQTASGSALLPTDVQTATQPAVTPIGWLHFSDDNRRHDQVTLILTGIPDPADGTVYQGWLIGEGEDPLNLGQLTLDEGAVEQTYADLQGTNLLATYQQVLVTLETTAEPATIPGETVRYAGEISTSVADDIGRLLLSDSEAPNGVSLVDGALSQGALASQHALLQQESIEAGDAAAFQTHVEHVANILSGEDDPNFGDHNQNGEIENPGDGFGLLGINGYILQTVELARTIQTAAPHLTELVTAAQNLEIFAANVLDWLLEAEALERSISGLAPTDPDVSEATARIVALTGQAYQGLDANGDNRIDPIPGEGGLLTLYQEAQKLAGMPLYTVSVTSLTTSLTGTVVLPDGLANLPDGPGWHLVQPANAGPSPRYGQTMAYHQDTNQVFLFGGQAEETLLNDLWVLDPDSMTWRSLATEAAVKPPGRRHTLVLIDAEGQNLYLVGGQGLEERFNDIWRLNLAVEIWEDVSAVTGTPPAARYGSPGGDIEGSLILAHGFAVTQYDIVWAFNPQAGKWTVQTPTGPLALKRSDFAATSSGTKLIFHGGCAADFGECYLADTWVMDTAAQTWREIQSAARPEGRQQHSLVAVNEETILLFGGQSADQAARNDVSALNLTTDQWTPLLYSDAPPARTDHGAVWVPDIGMLVFGGRAGDLGELGDLWRLTLDPSVLQ